MRHGLIRAARFQHVEAGVAEKLRDHRPDENIVLGDQKPCRHARNPPHHQDTNTIVRSINDLLNIDVRNTQSVYPESNNRRGGIMTMRALSFATPLLTAALLAQPANAAFTVFGNGLAQLCSQTAKNLEHGIAPPLHAIEDCTTAIEYEDLPSRDRAGTYINRGILFMNRTLYMEAKKDFDSALAIMPTVGEAYVDRGAAQVGLRNFSAAIADIDRGLALNPDEPEKAYFNRGLAEEGLDNIPAAYRDYAHAAELKPGWAPPLNELSRFTVTTRRS
jgi:tetratricopeptide (TPR) repeat protein